MEQNSMPSATTVMRKTAAAWRQAEAAGAARDHAGLLMYQASIGTHTGVPDQ